MEGFILVNKPVGMTSRDCVSQIEKIIRKVTNQKIKVGHTGTLDMRANGLLIIGIGRTATREIKYFLELDKRYTATAQLGYLTDSLDLNGTVLQEGLPFDHVTHHDLEHAIKSLGMRYWQIPPLYSALKHNGERLSVLARKQHILQEDLERIARRKQRLIDLHSVTLDAYKKPYMTLSAHVSHGTYIRTLVDDIAQKVGTRATTIELKRTAIGNFLLKDAVDISVIKKAEDIDRVIVPIKEMLIQLDMRKNRFTASM